VPNIEAYCLSHAQVELLRKIIKNKLPEIFEETVFTISPAIVIDSKGRIAPYVRITDNSLEVAHKIQKLICSNPYNELDVEILIISEFHPKNF